MLGKADRKEQQELQVVVDKILDQTGLQKKPYSKKEEEIYTTG